MANNNKGLGSAKQKLKVVLGVPELLKLQGIAHSITKCIKKGN